MPDVLRYRAEFPALATQVYLNHAGVAPTSLRVAAAVRAWMDDLVHHGLANESAWEARAELARARAARLVGAAPGEIAFVRNTSHGLGLVAEGLAWAPGDEVAVATSIEYPSNVYPWLHLRDRGVGVRAIEPERGGVTPGGVLRALSPRTKLVAVSSVQYATGAVTDLDAIGAICAERGLLFCVDGIQSVGCVPTDVKKSGVHFLAADSHKWMLGINGIGFLYVDEKVLPRLRPVLVGWKSTTGAWNFDEARFELRPDASRFEEGSPAYTGLYALEAALGLLEEVTVPVAAARIAALLDELGAGLAAAGCDVSPGPGARAGILTFTPPSGTTATLAEELVASGFKISVRRGRVRVSPHFTNVPEEMRALVARVRASCP